MLVQLLLDDCPTEQSSLGVHTERGLLGNVCGYLRLYASRVFRDGSRVHCRHRGQKSSHRSLVGGGAGKQTLAHGPRAPRGEDAQQRSMVFWGWGIGPSLPIAPKLAAAKIPDSGTQHRVKDWRAIASPAFNASVSPRILS